MTEQKPLPGLFCENYAQLYWRQEDTTEAMAVFKRLGIKVLSDIKTLNNGLVTADLSKNAAHYVGATGLTWRRS